MVAYLQHFGKVKFEKMKWKDVTFEFLLLKKIICFAFKGDEKTKNSSSVQILFEKLQKCTGIYFVFKKIKKICNFFEKMWLKINPKKSCIWKTTNFEFMKCKKINLQLLILFANSFYIFFYFYYSFDHKRTLFFLGLFPKL